MDLQRKNNYYLGKNKKKSPEKTIIGKMPEKLYDRVSISSCEYTMHLANG